MTLPLRGALSGECHKSEKLLKRALTVVHFSPVMRIAEASGAGIASFQEEIRRTYPVCEFELEQVIQFTVDGNQFKPTVEDLSVWRFFDADRTFRLSLTRETIAVETKPEGYGNRQSFAKRTAEILRAVATHFQPARVNRVGVRYVNLVEVEDENQLRSLCNPRLISVTGSPDLLQADLSWQFAVDEGRLILRSGIMPENSTYDPGILDLVKVRSWYLDIDVVDVADQEFDGDAIAVAVAKQVERAHAIYRWALEAEEAGQV